MGQGQQLSHLESQQEILNNSVDPTFKVLAIELLGYDSVNGVLRRVSVNTSGVIQSA